MDDRAISVDITDFEDVLALARKQLGLGQPETVRWMLDIAAWTYLRSTRSRDAGRTVDERFLSFTVPTDREIFEEPARFHDAVIKLIGELSLPSTQIETVGEPSERATIVHWHGPESKIESERLHSAATARGFGIARGEITMTPDFDAPIPDLEDFFA